MNTRHHFAGLVLVAFASSLRADFTPGAVFNPQENIAFPKCDFVIDVTQPPYRAKGDGITDDTEAIQKALKDMMGLHKILYFPNGTYLISKSLRWSNQNSQKQNAYGFNWIQGQNTGKTIIRLKDKTFTDPKKAESMMWCGGYGSADWFHNYFQNLTFSVGKENPGAIGLQFYSNNTGAVRDVAFVSEDGKGVMGLDLAPADMNGPLLVKNVSVTGFEMGIRCGAVVNSQTMEKITLQRQTRIGIENAGQSISIRGLDFRGEVPALDAQSFTVLLDSRLRGEGKAKSVPGIKVGTHAFMARNVSTTGFEVAIRSAEKKDFAGPDAKEYLQGWANAPFGSPLRSIGLPVEETPEVTWDSPKEWAVVDTFGADPTGGKDSSAAIQKALDSGASTVFFPGFYTLKSPVKVRGKVKRLLGCGAWIDYNHQSKPDFIIEDGDSPLVTLEHFEPINGGIEINTNRTVLLRSLGTGKITCKKNGKVFLEDVVTNDLKINPEQKLWARQLDIENEGTHLTNEGGKLWVLGYKTERGGTLLKTEKQGASEIFGNFSYTTTAGKLAPMFVTEDSSVFAFFNEVCYSGDPFTMWIREIRSGIKKEVKRNEGGLMPYVSGGENKK